jgi:hypothetical protein
MHLRRSSQAERFTAMIKPVLSMTQICEVGASSTEAVSWVDRGVMSPDALVRSRSYPRLSLPETGDSIFLSSGAPGPAVSSGPVLKVIAARKSWLLELGHSLRRRARER